MSNFVDYVSIHCKSGHGGGKVLPPIRRKNIFRKEGLMVETEDVVVTAIMKGNAHE